MKFWWEEKEGENLANAVTDTVNQLISENSFRYNLNMDMLRMYTGRDYELWTVMTRLCVVRCLMARIIG